MHLNKNIIIILLILFGLNSCILKKIPGGDAKKNPPDPKLRVQKNLEEGRGFNPRVEAEGDDGVQHQQEGCSCAEDGHDGL